MLIFLRFGWCVGQVGLVPTLGAVLLSAACQSLCASSLSAVATNGIVTRSGGTLRETRPSHGPTYLPPYPTLAFTHIHVCVRANAHHNCTALLCTGAYLMVVKALGLGPGASVGFFYWLGMTALMAVEIYGFAEGAELLV